MLQSRVFRPVAITSGAYSADGFMAKRKRANPSSSTSRIALVTAGTTKDKNVRNAQLYWISVAQYTIDQQRQDRAKKRRNDKIIPSLPPLPSNVKPEFPYR
jgi:hypothetical protein